MPNMPFAIRKHVKQTLNAPFTIRSRAALPIRRVSHPNPPRAQATDVPYPRLPIPNAAPSVNAPPPSDVPPTQTRREHKPPSAPSHFERRIAHKRVFPSIKRAPAHLPLIFPPPARSSFSKHLHHPAVDASLQLFSQLRRSSGSASAVCVTPPSVRVLSPSIPMRL